MRKLPSDAVVRAWMALVRAQQVTVRRVERILKDAGLPALNAYDVLWELDKAGRAGLRPFELEQQMLFTQWNLSRLIERLAQEGLVERRRTEEDGRGHRVVLTPAGKALRRRMWAVHAEAITAVMGPGLSDAQADALSGLLGPLGTPPIESPRRPDRSG